MSGYPPPVQRLHDALARVPGVKDVELGLRDLAGIDLRTFSFPGEFGDLPHALLRRTTGGLKDEVLVTAELHFRQDHAGWVAVEFLAWWVRDLSRSGDNAQMRPLALPPVPFGTQLGRTLKFVIEFFLINPAEDNGPVLERIERLAGSLGHNLSHYAAALANPTRADHDSIESVRRSAENDDAQAQFVLAQCYARGSGVAADSGEAFRWYQRAANHGHPRAHLQVGMCYAEGEGTQADLARAAESYRRAADAGVAQAMGLLGDCYENGKGVGQNLAEAVNWYRRGAEASDIGSQAQLALCYEQGRGVAVDRQEALRWYRAALEQGFEPVRPAIEALQAELGPPGQES
jgi:hypothetical protein